MGAKSKVKKKSNSKKLKSASKSMKKKQLVEIKKISAKSKKDWKSKEKSTIIEIKRLTKLEKAKEKRLLKKEKVQSFREEKLLKKEKEKDLLILQKFQTNVLRGQEEKEKSRKARERAAIIEIKRLTKLEKAKEKRLLKKEKAQSFREEKLRKQRSQKNLIDLKLSQAKSLLIFKKQEKSRKARELVAMSEIKRLTKLEKAKEKNKLIKDKIKLVSVKSRLQKLESKLASVLTPDPAELVGKISSPVINLSGSLKKNKVEAKVHHFKDKLDYHLLLSEAPKPREGILNELDIPVQESLFHENVLVNLSRSESYTPIIIYASQEVKELVSKCYIHLAKQDKDLALLFFNKIEPLFGKLSSSDKWTFYSYLTDIRDRLIMLEMDLVKQELIPIKKKVKLKAKNQKFQRKKVSKRKVKKKLLKRKNQSKKSSKKKVRKNKGKK